jgi:hypothetical protein
VADAGRVCVNVVFSHRYDREYAAASREARPVSAASNHPGLLLLIPIEILDNNRRCCHA